MRFVSLLILVLSLAPGLRSVRAADVTRGPYLQTGSPTQVTLRWRTNVETGTRVELGDSTDALITVYSDPAPTTEHTATLTGLTLDTRYFYAIGDVAQRLAGGTAEFWFKTSPEPGKARRVRIWALGDGGTGGDGTGRAEAVRDGYYKSAIAAQTDVWLMLGDNAYYVGADEEYQRAVFNTFTAQLRNTVLWSTMGNHEYYTALGAPYFQIFNLPTQGEAGGVPSGTEHYYSFDYAHIHFICLDSMMSDRRPGSPMLEWLEEDLAATKQKWIIAFWHHPPYTKGSHNSDFETELVEMRQNVLPILEAGGVDLVLGGHSHSYERSFFIDGHYGTSDTFTPAMVKDLGNGRQDGDGYYGKDPEPHAGAVYIVAGTSGQVSGGSIDHPAMCVSLLTLGSLAIDVDGDRMDVRFVDSEGLIRDYFTINKAPLITVNAGGAGELQAFTAIRENGNGAAKLELSRTRGLESDVTVNLALGGSATSGIDFRPLAEKVTIPAGGRSVQLSVTPIPDNLAEGTETVRVFAADGVGYRTSRVSHSAIVFIQDPPHDAWKFAEFGDQANNAAIGGDHADPDGDGIPNLFERAFGTDPLRADRSAFLTGHDNVGLTLTFPHPSGTDDLTYIVQVSNDLLHWDNGSRYSGSGNIRFNQFTTEIARQPGNPEMITVRDNVPFGAAPARYIRLQVTRE